MGISSLIFAVSNRGPGNLKNLKISLTVEAS